MNETANEIEAQIDPTRERLGSNLRDLEDKCRRRLFGVSTSESGRTCFSARRLSVRPCLRARSSLGPLVAHCRLPPSTRPWAVMARCMRMHESC